MHTYHHARATLTFVYTKCLTESSCSYFVLPHTVVSPPGTNFAQVGRGRLTFFSRKLPIKDCRRLTPVTQQQKTTKTIRRWVCSGVVMVWGDCEKGHQSSLVWKTPCSFLCEEDCSFLCSQPPFLGTKPKNEKRHAPLPCLLVLLRPHIAK